MTSKRNLMPREKDPLDEIFVDKHPSFDRNDWIDMNKEDMIVNMKCALDKIDKFEKTEELLVATEKARLELLNENLEMKKQLGQFKTVKNLMDSAGVYGYTDLIKTHSKEEAGEELSKLKDKTLSNKIEIVGFHTEVIFKDKDGNKKIVNATKGEKGLKVKDVREFIKKLKEGMDSMFHTKGQFLKHEHIEKFIDKLAGEELVK